MDFNFEKFKEELKKRAPPKKGIHSFAHSVVKDVCDWFGIDEILKNGSEDEKKRAKKEFGFWLGITKRVGAGTVQAKLKDLKERFQQTGDKKYKEPRYLAGCLK